MQVDIQFDAMRVIENHSKLPRSVNATRSLFRGGFGEDGVSIVRNTSWFWQLSGSIDLDRSAKVYDLDLFLTSEDIIALLRNRGHIVICYFSAGSYEDWRDDVALLDPVAIGAVMDGWEDEKWLDIRHESVRRLMADRLDLAHQKGCDGVEPDNVDGFENATGFAISRSDQLVFNRYLADQAHDLGLSIGLKNATSLVRDLQDQFDWSLVEECAAYSECADYIPFSQAGKAVFQAEYSEFDQLLCDDAAENGFSLGFFSLELDGQMTLCD